MKITNFIFLGSLLFFFASCSSDDLGDASKGDSLQPEATISGELITLQSGVIVEKRNGMYFYSGDIALSDNQLKILDETGDIFENSQEIENLNFSDSTVVNVTSGITAYYKDADKLSRAGGKHSSQNAYWAMCRFSFGSNLSSSARQKAVQAIKHIEARTNVRFYNATFKPTIGYGGFKFPYVEIIDSERPDVSWSHLGRIGGRQVLAIAEYANVGSVIHEFCHALAMFHEHQRYDRDDYVTVNYNNIKEKEFSQFDKRKNNYFIVGGFDFNSIMLYDSYSFTKNGSATMTKKNGQTFSANRTGLSDFDRSWLNSIYIPYIARSDAYRELAEKVYKPNNQIMTPQERQAYQARLNNGRQDPPSNGRIPNIIE